MKNVLFFVFAIALISFSPNTFANNGDNNNCCGKTALNVEISDPANYGTLVNLNTLIDRIDTSNKENKRVVDTVVPLYDLSLAHYNTPQNQDHWLS